MHKLSQIKQALMIRNISYFQGLGLTQRTYTRGKFKLKLLNRIRNAVARTV